MFFENHPLLIPLLVLIAISFTVFLYWVKRMQQEIDQRETLKEELQKNRESLAKAQEIARLGSWEWEIQTGKMFWSDEVFRIFGVDSDTTVPSYNTYMNAVHPDDRNSVRNQFVRSVDAAQPDYFFEHRVLLSRGEVRVVRAAGEVSADEEGEPAIMRGTIQDITKARQNEQNLMLSHLVIENASESVFVTDSENRIIDINPAYEKTTGYTGAEVVGKNPGIFTSGKQDDEFYKEMWEKIAREGRWAGEIWDRRKSGEIYPAWLTISTIENYQGKVDHYVGIFSDISHQKSSEKALEKLAFYDPLTQLPNRALFRDRINHEVSVALRNGTSFAVCFLDLDRFKYVNDTFGHDMGDELLKEVGKRIVSCVRKSDSVCRLGGDEFTMILAKSGNDRSIGRVTAKVIEALKKPFLLRGNEIFIGASIGISVFPEDGKGYRELTKNADLAMYQAKEEGRGTYKFFSEEMNTRNAIKHSLEVDLRQALKEQQFFLHYQPKLNVGDTEVSGMEALIRWEHPERGVVPPMEFIPMAEDTGLILAMSEWILREACQQTGLWLKELECDLRVAVNLSAKQFQDPDLSQKVAEILLDTGLSPNNLEFEITESTIMKNADLAAKTMGKIRDMGIHISIDDFGTGYSSLSYLKRFPLHSLKIDKSFVRDMTTDSDDAAIIQAIISMAHALGLGVVAEGVENEEQLGVLRNNRCDTIQGYFLCKPLDADQFPQFLSRPLASSFLNR